jgi:hypothetical protein
LILINFSNKMNQHAFCSKFIFILAVWKSDFKLKAFSMLLHQQFVRIAKKFAKKLAIIDKTTGKSIDYSTALIGSLILCSRFNKYDKGFIGIMIPTSAGCALASVAALMSGRIPVMIN